MLCPVETQSVMLHHDSLSTPIILSLSSANEAPATFSSHFLQVQDGTAPPGLQGTQTLLGLKDKQPARQDPRDKTKHASILQKQHCVLVWTVALTMAGVIGGVKGTCVTHPTL